MSICRGCGAVLQSTDPKAPGYTPKEGAQYCQRCFRLIHYDDLTVSMRKGIDPDEVLKKIQETDAVILWIVDLFDFEAGMIPGLSRKLDGKDIILVCTKRDLLPDTLNHEKIAQFVFRRLKEEGIKVQQLILSAMNERDSVPVIQEAVKKYAKGRPVMVMGRANSGKSTLLNRMMAENVLTASRYPGTTLDFNTLEIDGQTYIDTPGIEIEHSILMCTKEEDLRFILPQHTIKPLIFQIHEPQSFAIGGLARLDVDHVEKATVTFYVSDAMEVHRGRLDTADELWKKHYGEMLKPVPLKKEFTTVKAHKDFDKMDVVIEGLGFACITGKADNVAVKAPKGVDVIFRKAMI